MPVTICQNTIKEVPAVGGGVKNFQCIDFVNHSVNLN